MAHDDDHQNFPSRKRVDTESEAIRRSRGKYAFARLGPDKLTCAVYATQMIRQEQLWKFVAVHDCVIGDFL